MPNTVNPILTFFEGAKDILNSNTKKVFETLNTTDFEAVMKYLLQAETLTKIYDPGNSILAQKFAEDANILRDILAKAIASNHPERMDEIPDGKFVSCRKFLSNFKKGKIYTLNYDLLLYWALMRSDIDNLNVTRDDGFRFPSGDPKDYVVWDFGDARNQNLFYLHGALHIFDAGAEIQKYTWSNTGIALVDQIREALEENRFPIYVAEGTSDFKLNRILHNSFLIRGYRSLSEIGGSLFIFGHSLQENDDHVLKCIERNKVKKVCVSIFGGPNTSDNQYIINRANALAQGRKSKFDKGLEVQFFDAESAEVWGNT